MSTRPLGEAALAAALAGELGELLAGLEPLAAEAFENAMRAGIAAGANPADIARQAAAGVEGLPKARALTIARTEAQRAYRTETLERYRASRGAVAGWTWLSSQDRTTCAMCWAMHGTVHRLDEEMASHANCRCTMVPIPQPGLGPEPPAIPPGEEAFARLSEGEQRAILGRGKFDLYQAGAIRLEDLVRRTDRGRREATLREVREPPPSIERPELTVREFRGEEGNLDHVTRIEEGEIPTAAIADLRGVRGEVPGEHRNRQGAEWQAFLDDIRENGITEPIFVTVDWDDVAKISEGNHRRDAALELGLERVPVEVRYFGHAERQGTLMERARLPPARVEAGAAPDAAWKLHNEGLSWSEVSERLGQPVSTVRAAAKRYEARQGRKRGTVAVVKPKRPKRPEAEKAEFLAAERERMEAKLAARRRPERPEPEPEDWREPDGSYHFATGDPMPYDQSPMTNPQYTRVRGVLIVVDRDLDLQAHARQAAELLDTWPAAERANLRQMRFISRFADSRPGMRGDSIRATGSSGRGVITWWNQNGWARQAERKGKPDIMASQTTFDHEMGHIVGRDNGGPPHWDSWESAMKADRSVASRDLTDRIRLDQPLHFAGVTPGKRAVTGYGGTNTAEDWAESMMLYKHDQRFGRIGYTADKWQDAEGVWHQAETPVRFADVWPQRASIIESHLRQRPAAAAPPRPTVAEPRKPTTRLAERQRNMENLRRMERERAAALRAGDRRTAQELQRQITALRRDMQPSRPSPVRREPVTTTPPKEPWVEPPAPKGKPGGRAGGFTATGHTNTQLGDLAEAVVAKLDMRSLLPEGHRQNPLDSEWDGSGWGFEIKAVTTASTEYKVRMKAKEMASKIAYAEEHNLEAGTMMVVMDLDAAKAYVYWREGIVSARLSKNRWHHMGVVDISTELGRL